MDPIQYIIQQARRRNLDPNAVLAVGDVEGLSGRIGDSGHAYGPFQLNNAGGVITSRFPGAYRQDVQRWAFSPQGINFALDRMANVAAGLHGRNAIAAIVSRFERPKNIPGEIASASQHYGRVGRAGRAMAPAGGFDTSSVGRPQPPRRAAASTPGLDVSGIINLTNSIVGLPPVPIQITQPGTPAVTAPRRARVSSGRVRTGAPPPRRGGRSLNWLEHFAAPFGVQVTSTTSGNHVKNSYHYRGRAVDFGGDPARMAALARYAVQHHNQITEMFYSGPGNPGVYVKDGQVIPLSQLDRGLIAEHRNHVHIAR